MGAWGADASSREKPHPPPDGRGSARVRRRRGRHRAALAAAHQQRFHGRGAAASHAGIRRQIPTPSCVKWIACSRARVSFSCSASRPGARGACVRKFSRVGFPPGMRRVLSEKRVRDWLVLLGYEVVASQHSLFVNPWGSGSHPGEGTGRYLRRGLNPFPAGAYLLKARKRVYTLTPIRPRFREKPVAIEGLVISTTRRLRQVPSIVNHLEIYTDGACRGNPGSGGWAVLLISGDACARSFPAANRRPRTIAWSCMGAIRGLEALEKPAVRAPRLHRLVVCHQRHQRMGGVWKRRGWKTADKKARKESGSVGTS